MVNYLVDNVNHHCGLTHANEAGIPAHGHQKKGNQYVFNWLPVRVNGGKTG
jgi:hypothetical protein